uniref:Aldehyde dehydrogenase 8 member A1 n=1 Tax=Platynereis dumerilii TaxID=6359 RepID=A0A2R4A6S5_PLADU|nr:aldehyde dehydrogenase 8 member A1 [Platynereis dumerilii]
MPYEITVENFINGEFEQTPKYMDSPDPSTGEVWARIPDSGPEDIDRAVKAANDAFQKWSCTPEEQRSKLLLKVADLIDEHLEELACYESRDQGKPLWLARKMDIPRSSYNFRVFATSILNHIEKSHFQEQFETLNYTSRMAVGVAGLISPWNLPLYLLTFKIAPAIALGNTVVCKPSEMTSVTAWRLCGLLNEAGIPPGVVNMVFGTGARAGHALVIHPDVPLVSFTGSTATAEKIKTATASMNKKLSLELGGKNPALVFEDADLDKCIPEAARSCFTNQGEICLCTSRIFVHSSIFSRFVETFVDATRQIVVGDPRDPETKCGPLVSKEHWEKVTGYVQVALQEGSKIFCGESVDTLTLPEKNKNGYYVQPTVVTEVMDSSRLMQEEIFGPVVCIVPFQTEEEVIQRANNVKYGLSASVWTNDLARTHRVARKLQAGTVWCNCWLVRDLLMPFGGMKASGIGREGAQDSLEFFTEVKNICVKCS